MHESSEPSSIPAILLSDSTIREAGSGKLSLIGMFEYFNAPNFPFVTPPFFVTVGIANFQGQLQSVPVTVRIESSTGHVHTSAEATFSTKEPINRNDVVQFPFAIPPCQFPEAGRYNVVLLVSGEKIGERPIEVRAITSSGPKPD